MSAVAYTVRNGQLVQVPATKFRIRRFVCACGANVRIWSKSKHLERCPKK